MVTKTAQELDEMKLLIREGKLPPDAIKQYYDAEAKNVFGFDAKKTRKGYAEQGYGSPGNQTNNSIAAYRKYHGPGSDDPDPDFVANLARMTQELKESNERRAAEREAAR